MGIQETRIEIITGDILEKGVFRKQVAKNLIASREAAGLSQKDVAEQVGLTSSSLSSYERGCAIPSLRVASELASIYGTSLDTLCGIERVLKTYAEVTKLLLWIISTPGLQITINEKGIQFHDLEMIDFLKSLKSLEAMQKAGVLDQDFFQFWKNRQFAKYYKSIGGE